MRRLAAVLVLVGLAGCGGAGSAPPAGGSGSGSGKGGDSAKVLFTITIPKSPASSSKRARPDYVSSNTQSLGVTVNGGTAQVFGLTPSTDSDCSSTSGSTVCTLQAAAPPGTDSFAFALYEQAVPLPTNPTALSVAVVSNQVIAEGVANQLGTFTLNPVLGSVALSLGEPGGGFSPGTASSDNAVNLTAKDPSGAVIIAPGDYANSSDTLTPITLSASTSPFTFSVDSGSYASTGTLNGPSDSATYAYSGTGLSGTTTIEAASGSITASQTIGALLAPIVITLGSSASAADYHVTTSPAELDFYESSISGTATLSEEGYSGSFSVESSTCSNSEVSLSQSGDTFTVNAVAAGTSGSPALCSVTFEDSNGQTASATFSVTTVSFGLQ